MASTDVEKIMYVIRKMPNEDIKHLMDEFAHEVARRVTEQGGE